MLDCDLPHLKWGDCTPPNVMFNPSLIIRSIVFQCPPGLPAGARLRFAPISRTYKRVLSFEKGIASSLSPNINTKYSLNVQICKTTFKHFLRSQQSVSPFPFNRYSRSCICSVNHVALQPTKPFTAVLPPILFSPCSTASSTLKSRQTCLQALQGKGSAFTHLLWLILISIRGDRILVTSRKNKIEGLS